MKKLSLILPIVLLLLGAAPPPPISPPPPPVRSLFDQPLPGQSSAWNRIQDSIDRSTGRITDEPTHELNQLHYYQQEQLGNVTPPEQFNEFEAEHERQLRLDQRAGKQSPPLTRQDLDRREYELFLNAGLSPTALQTNADEQALLDAQAKRDQQLIDAQNAPNSAEYAKRVKEIRQQYEKERERILGFGPTTQPTK
jgi:hypothetical protein